jgi:hypothetical protein
MTSYLKILSKKLNKLKPKDYRSDVYNKIYSMLLDRTQGSSKCSDELKINLLKLNERIFSSKML